MNSFNNDSNSLNNAVEIIYSGIYNDLDANRGGQRPVTFINEYPVTKDDIKKIIKGVIFWIKWRLDNPFSSKSSQNTYLKKDEEFNKFMRSFSKFTSKIMFRLTTLVFEEPLVAYEILSNNDSLRIFIEKAKNSSII